MQRFLIFVGVAIVLIGVTWPWLRRLPLGRLPGDIVHRGEHGTFYFPIVTCIVLSVLASLILWLLRK